MADETQIPLAVGGVGHRFPSDRSTPDNRPADGSPCDRRSASGRELERAVVPSTPASSCAMIQFTLNGKPQTPLIDSTPMDGMALYARVQKIVS